MTLLLERKFQRFEEELARRKRQVLDYLNNSRYSRLFFPEDVRDSVYRYINAAGKTLRPGVLLFCCGAVGGDEERAIPAAAAVEVFHTWTMVHDDLMDRDTLRRGQPTVHEAIRRRALTRTGYDGEEASHYGQSIAMMTGEIQHGWAVSLLTDLFCQGGVNHEVTITLIRELETEVLCTLVGGQTQDVQYEKMPLGVLKEADILQMLWRKTGALIQYAGKAGAMIGLEVTDGNHPLVKALSAFTGHCGTAFQLQDDILGIVGDEAKLGKPVGSDIREGKRTVLMEYTFRQASPAERSFLQGVLGSSCAPLEAVEQVIQLVRTLGGIAYTQNLARQYIKGGLQNLAVLPPSPYKELLETWAEYLVERTF